MFNYIKRLFSKARSLFSPRKVSPPDDKVIDIREK